MVRLHLRYILIVIIFFDIRVLFYLLLMMLMQCILNTSNLEPCVFLCHYPLHLALLVSRIYLILSHSLWNLHFIMFNVHIVICPPSSTMINESVALIGFGTRSGCGGIRGGRRGGKGVVILAGMVIWVTVILWFLDSIAKSLDILKCFAL